MVDGELCFVLYCVSAIRNPGVLNRGALRRSGSATNCHTRTVVLSMLNAEDLKKNITSL